MASGWSRAGRPSGEGCRHLAEGKARLCVGRKQRPVSDDADIFLRHSGRRHAYLRSGRRGPGGRRSGPTTCDRGGTEPVERCGSRGSIAAGSCDRRDRRAAPTNHGRPVQANRSKTAGLAALRTGLRSRSFSLLRSSWRRGAAADGAPDGRADSILHWMEPRHGAAAPPAPLTPLRRRNWRRHRSRHRSFPRAMWVQP